MREWVLCYYFDVNKPNGVFPVEGRTENTVSIIFEDKSYEIPVERTKNIDEPEYRYGDLVYPANHIGMDGVVCNISYHFERNEPMYFISINGKKKPKRYFKGDLVRKGMDLERN